jgi:hypothetical protein
MITTMWIWLVVGCIPYAANRNWSASGTRTLTITAIFWRVQIERATSADGITDKL